MTNNFKRWIIGLNLAFLLLFVAWSVMQKERILSKGALVLMPLAPVDPRSLMQGDYMQLRYAATANVYKEPPAKRGFLVVTTDVHHVASPVRMQPGKSPVNPNEYLIRYAYTDYTLEIGASAYFFQEGKAERFSHARFGGLRVDGNGNSVLAGLYDSSYRFIAP